MALEILVWEVALLLLEDIKAVEEVQEAAVPLAHPAHQAHPDSQVKMVPPDSLDKPEITAMVVVESQPDQDAFSVPQDLPVPQDQMDPLAQPVNQDSQEIPDKPVKEANQAHPDQQVTLEPQEDLASQAAQASPEPQDRVVMEHPDQKDPPAQPANQASPASPEDKLDQASQAQQDPPAHPASQVNLVAMDNPVKPEDLVCQAQMPPIALAQDAQEQLPALALLQQATEGDKPKLGEAKEEAMAQAALLGVVHRLTLLVEQPPRQVATDAVSPWWLDTVKPKHTFITILYCLAFISIQEYWRLSTCFKK